MAKSKRIAVVEKEKCVACGTCWRDCPKEAIRIFRGIWAEVDADICVGCGKCHQVCPAMAIHMEERV